VASVSKRITASGQARYDVRYRTLANGVRTRTFRKRRDAQRFATTVEGDKLRGDWVDPRQGVRTLTDVAAEWLQSNPAKRTSTAATDRSHLRARIEPKLGAQPVGRITRRDVQAAVNSWAAELSPRTVRRVFGTLSSVLNYAAECELIVRSPCRGVKLPAVSTPRRPLPSPDDLRRLADEVGPDLAPLVYLGAVLGLRWGECAALRVGRIDFMRSTLSVAEQITRGPRGEPVTGPPKSAAGERTLTMPRQLVELLAAHLARKGLTGSDRDTLVFTMPRGGPLTYQNWRIRVWQPACDAANLHGLGFHDLRRLNATGLMMEGVDVKTAQARLGHADPRLTLAVYAQATTEADRDAAQRLGSRFMTPPADDKKDARDQTRT
jgi:integrase